MSDYEYGFDPADANNTAASVYRLVSPGGDRVLDLGSGPAIVSSYLAKHDGKDVTCIDSSAESLANARDRGIVRTIEADLNQEAWIEDLDDDYDVVVLADVLEHLVEPQALVETIATAGLLAEGGYLVISIPNAGHEAVLAELIKGRFTYQDTGLLDSTHVRFFTLASLRELLERSGFFITQVERTHRTAEQTSLAVHDVTLPDELRDRVLEASPEAQTYQFIVKAEHSDAARDLAEVRERLEQAEARLKEGDRVEQRASERELRGELDVARTEATRIETELAEARLELASAKQRVTELEEALHRERKLTAAERKRLERTLAEGTSQVGAAELERAHREVARLEKRLREIYESRTWKVGRAAWTAFHAPAKLVRGRRGDTEPVRMTSPSAPSPNVVRADYSLAENTNLRDKYEAALQRTTFTGTGRAVVFAVSTTDLDAGRGDLYTAIGLGKHLEHSDSEVMYLPQDRWYDVPAGTDVYVAMLETVDVTRLPGDLATVAWVRNQTEVWRQQPWLPLYDMVLASSQASLDAIAQVYPGPMGLLPIGVDTEVFALAPGQGRTGVASTVNQWGREREVFTFLKERTPDFPLALYGQQRGLAAELSPYARGPVSFFALPSLYNQAQIVLDDFNHTTAGYGNVNSRLFEAAACGAIVMTNRAAGLEPLGLDDLPVYSTAASLFELIGRDLNSTAAASRADDLRQVVIERHSYEQRATEFNDHLARLMEGGSSREGIVVGYYPDYRDNPYTEMMWSDLRKRHGVAVPVDNSLDFTATVKAAEHRTTVFHINWTAPILGGAKDEHDRLVRHRRFLEAIDEMHSKGIPSIWTVHNVLPHECADPELEAQLRQEIADRVDAIHVMCADTVAACSDWYTLPETKVRVIPHPGYVDVYPNLIDRETARDELGLAPNDFVYLHFGQVRPYKGIDRLLDAFEQIPQEDPDAKLMLVGKPGRFEGIRQIQDRARANANVIANFNPVPDADVQLYMNAADVVVLPHQKALNSGALLLAYSFARPVVAAATGCMAGMVDDATGITFDPQLGTTALLNAMLFARSLGPEHGKAAFERAQKLHYLGIGKRFSEVVDELLAGMRS